MTKKDTFEIALMIFGLYLLTVTFDGLIGLAKSSIHLFETDSESKNNLGYFIINSFRAVFYFLGFWMFTFKADFLAENLIKKNSDSAAVFSVDKTDLLQILFSASAIIILFLSINELWQKLVAMRLWDYNIIDKRQLFVITLTQIIILALKGIIALVLLFNSGGLARWMTRKKTKTT